jgi:hypothetical protein
MQPERVDREEAFELGTVREFAVEALADVPGISIAL